jgi:hypothetical protein
MQAKRWIVACAGVFGLCAAVAVVRSDEKPGQEGHEDMTPEIKAMHEAYMKAGTPGPEHERLAKMAGKWKADVQFWHGPGEPETSLGVAEFKPILGGRYMEEIFNGEADGQPFEGRGISGYDNIKKKYIGLWMDSMSTSVLMTEGEWNDAEKAVVSHADSVDPLGNKWHIRSVAREEGDNKQVYEMYKTGADGKEFKNLQVTYTRM